MNLCFDIVILKYRYLLTCVLTLWYVYWLSPYFRQ